MAQAAGFGGGLVARWRSRPVVAQVYWRSLAGTFGAPHMSLLARAVDEILGTHKWSRGLDVTSGGAGVVSRGLGVTAGTGQSETVWPLSEPAAEGGQAAHHDQPPPVGRGQSGVEIGRHRDRGLTPEPRYRLRPAHRPTMLARESAAGTVPAVASPPGEKEMDLPARQPVLDL